MANLIDWKRRLRFRHLELLQDLHATHSLTRTAARQSMTQPALTKWLRELENDLGLALFTRHSRGVIPTAACELLVARARLLVNEVDRTAELLEVLAQGQSGKLFIGATPVAMADSLPSAVARLHHAYPDANISVADGYLNQLLPQLREGKLDLIVSMLEDRDYGGDLAQERLYLERFVVIGGPAHPLARRRKVSWAEAVACPWIGPPPDSPLRRELEQELALANQPLPRFAAQVSSNVLLAAILERSHMLSLVSSETAAYYESARRVRAVPVTILRSSHIGAIWRKEKQFGELESAFMQALRAVCAGRDRVKEAGR